VLHAGATNRQEMTTTEVNKNSSRRRQLHSNPCKKLAEMWMRPPALFSIRPTAVRRSRGHTHCWNQCSSYVAVGQSSTSIIYQMEIEDS